MCVVIVYYKVVRLCRVAWAVGTGGSGRSAGMVVAGGVVPPRMVWKLHGPAQTHSKNFILPIELTLSTA